MKSWPTTRIAPSRALLAERGLGVVRMGAREGGGGGGSWFDLSSGDEEADPQSARQLAIYSVAADDWRLATLSRNKRAQCGANERPTTQQNPIRRRAGRNDLGVSAAAES
uniref:Uncharacterized protein n=1 Tax=Plectus sambesii TaxID=2011161 RepID=A0A914VCA2_9BILA